MHTVEDHWGKDEIALHWAAIASQQRPGGIWHLLPEKDQARKAIWEAVNPRTGRRRIDDAFPRELISNARDTDMFIRFKNGSTWQVVGSDRFNALLGSPPVGVVFSEWALSDPKAWAYIRPILDENDGWAAFISCVSSDTLVLSDDGLYRMDELLEGKPYGLSPYRKWLFGLGGAHEATEAFRGRTQRTLKIATAKGYRLECTPIHPIWNGDKWIRAEQWSVGDILPIQVGQNVFRKKSVVPNWIPPTHGHCKPMPFNFDEDLYYFLGLVIAEGCWGEYVVNISSKDDEIRDFLSRYGFSPKDEAHSEQCNQALCSLIDWFGIKHGAKNKNIPLSLRTLSRKDTAALLQGYFDGDGCATKRGNVHCDSVSEDLINTIQTMLLNFGIIASKRKNIVPPTKRVKVFSTVFRLEINGHWAARFYREIGFRLSRKQARRRYLSRRQKEQRQDRYLVPAGAIEPTYWHGMGNGDVKRQVERGIIGHCTAEKMQKRRPHQFWEKLLFDGFHYDPIVSIEEGESEVFDFVIPETHSFFSNGFISHNTPRGHNHCYRTYELAKKTKDWFHQKISAYDTDVFSHDKLENILQEYIDEYGEDDGNALFKQEYQCSFDAPLVGSYYGSLMEKAEDEGRIVEELDFDPKVPVQTSWDLGYSDDTVIWFFQVFPREFRIIDYYANHGEPIEHYCEILEKKAKIRGFHYGEGHEQRHWVPWDARPKSFSSGGKSVIEQARGFGVWMRPTPQLSVQDGIQAVRKVLPMCSFDQERCAEGIDALRSYRRQWDPDKKAFRKDPVHDFSSHASDGFRMLAVSYQPPPKPPKPPPENPRGMEAVTMNELFADADKFRRQNWRV